MPFWKRTHCKVSGCHDFGRFIKRSHNTRLAWGSETEKCKHFLSWGIIFNIARARIRHLWTVKLTLHVRHHRSFSCKEGMNFVGFFGNKWRNSSLPSNSINEKKNNNARWEVIRKQMDRNNGRYRYQMQTTRFKGERGTCDYYVGRGLARMRQSVCRVQEQYMQGWGVVQ